MYVCLTYEKCFPSCLHHELVARTCFLYVQGVSGEERAAYSLYLFCGPTSAHLTGGALPTFLLSTPSPQPDLELLK